MSNPIQEVLDRIERRQSAKKASLVTTKIRYDGFQYSFPPEPGCHNFTYLGKGDGHGATICVEGQPEEKPDDATVERLMAAKIEEFCQAKKSSGTK